ncbi:MAG: nitroreductase family protein [Saprospiraceae bacterium]|nr:nitroreductase family protein [Saprospiraceae bacterium]
MDNTSSAKTFDEIVHHRRSVRIYDTSVPFDSTAVTRSLKRAHLAPNSSNLQLWEFYQVKSPEKKAELAKYCLGQPAATTANELVVIVTRKDLWQKRVDFMLRVVKKGFEKEDSDAAKKAEAANQNTKDTGNVLQKMANDKEARRKGVLQYYGKLIPQLYKGGVFAGWIKKLYVQLFMAPKKPSYREVGYHDTRIIAHKSAALAAQTFMLSMAAEGYDTCPMEGMDSARIKKLLGLPKGAEINMVIGCGTRKPEGVYGPRVRVANEKVIFEV